MCLTTRNCYGSEWEGNVTKLWSLWMIWLQLLHHILIWQIIHTVNKHCVIGIVMTEDPVCSYLFILRPSLLLLEWGRCVIQLSSFHSQIFHKRKLVGSAFRGSLVNTHKNKFPHSCVHQRLWHTQFVTKR
jgi:hypothetical protein